MDNNTKNWIKGTLANDEVSSDEELVDFFIEEGGLTKEEATQWVELRSNYLRNVFCDDEPSDQNRNEPIHILPTFKGYTIDMRLREFRKAALEEPPEFIPFNSREGKKLLSELKEFAGEILITTATT